MKKETNKVIVWKYFVLISSMFLIIYIVRMAPSWLGGIDQSQMSHYFTCGSAVAVYDHVQISMILNKN